MLEDRLLILRFNRGERGALHGLYDKYKDDLVTLAAALLLDVGAAEDVVHDVFLSFMGSAGRFQLTGSLKGYLMTCVANRARNHNKRSRRSRGPDLEDMPYVASQVPGPDQAAIFGEQLDHIRRALEQLPYEQREVLLLRSQGRMKFAAIGRAQDVSINTVQGRYRYAIQKLQSLLDCETER
jgi:RNA polymerase sigma-70 factor (ECF subfamily)